MRRWLLAALLVAVAAVPASGAEPDYVALDDDFLGPGGSDIQSLIPLLANPAVRLLGVTVVVGDGWENAESAHVRRFLEIADRTDVPVADGATLPLVNSVARMREREERFGPVPWKGAWGGTGSDAGVPDTQPAVGALPEGAPHTPATAVPAALFLIQAVRRHPHRVTIVAAGPMTNLALAIRLDPEFAALARQLVFMGGLVDTEMAAATGNANVASDFNLLFDPEAAHVVLTAPWPRIVSLGDVTNGVAMTPALMTRIAAVRTPVTDYLRRFATPLPLWDEMASAVAVRPELIRASATVMMDVDLSDGMDYGRARIWTPALAPKATGLRPVVMVTAIDRDRFLDGFVRDAQAVGTGTGGRPETRSDGPPCTRCCT